MDGGVVLGGNGFNDAVEFVKGQFFGAFMEGEHQSGIFVKIGEGFAFEVKDAKGVTALGVEEEFATVEENPIVLGIVVIGFTGRDAAQFMTLLIAEVYGHSEGKPGAFAETIHKPEPPVAAVIKAHVVDEADFAGIHNGFPGGKIEVVEKGARAFYGLGNEKGGQVKQADRHKEPDHPEGATDAEEAEPLGTQGDNLIIAVKVSNGEQEGNEEDYRQDQWEECRKRQEEVVDDLGECGIHCKEVREVIHHVLQDQNPDDQAKG